MFTEEDVQEAEKIGRDAGASLLLLLFSGSPRVAWDDVRKVFTVDGRRVTSAAMRRLVQRVEASSGKRLSQHVEALIDGTIDVGEWRRRMERSIAGGHLLAGALALGGVGIAKTDTELNQRVNAEIGYLGGFASDIRAGKMSEPRQRSRAGSYLIAMFVTFMLLDLREKKRAVKIVGGGIPKPPPRGPGITPPPKPPPVYREAMRIRSAAESCEGCIAYAGKWIPIEAMPPIGSLNCKGRCRCSLIYR